MRKYSIISPFFLTFSSHSKDARLPEQLQRAMAAEAEAAREARAKVIMMMSMIMMMMVMMMIR